MFVKLLVLICALFVAPQVFAEEGGVRGDTLIACPSGIEPVKSLIKGVNVWTMSEKGRVKSPISRVKSYKENMLIGVVIEGINKRGIKKKVEIVGAAGQRVFCPNRQEWVKFCELDQRFDLVYINFCEPTRIVKIKEYPLFWHHQTEKVYHFEVATYGMFFASELYVPLHNCDPVTLTLGACALGFSIEFLIACASSLAVIAAVNELDKLRGIKRHDEIDDNVKDLLKKLNKAQADKFAAANAPETVGEAASSQAAGNFDGASRDQAVGNANKSPQETPPSNQESNQDSNQDSGQGPNNQDPEDPNNGGKIVAGALGAKAAHETKKAVDAAANVAKKVSNAASKASKTVGNASKASKATTTVKSAPNATPKGATPAQNSTQPATQQATPKQATTPTQSAQNATQASAKQGATQQQPQPAQNPPAQNATQQAQPAIPPTNQPATQVATSAMTKQEIIAADRVVTSVQTDINLLTPDKIEHVINGSKNTTSNHKWDRLVPQKGWEDIRKIIEYVLENGQQGPYKTALSNKLIINGELVEVAYKEVDGIIRISGAWIK